MTDADVSAEILADRAAAGNPLLVCPICVRPPEAPYRRRNVAGTLIEGCVDATHTGRLTDPESIAWHDRGLTLRLEELGRVRAL